MAVVRARSTPPYGLILFVFLTVVFMALTVVFYLQGAKAEKDKEDSDKQLANVATSADLSALSVNLQNVPKTGNPTPVGQANAQLKKIQEALDAANATIGKLRGDLGAANSQNTTMKTQLDSLDKKVAEYNDNYTASIKAANATADDFKKQLVDANAQLAALRASMEQATAADQQTLTGVKSDAEQGRRDAVLQLDQLKQQLAAANTRVSTLQDQVNLLRPTVTTNVGREADGIVARTSTDTGEVYINLGKRDHLQIGQTFAVYDQKTGVRFSTDEEAQGKGSLEVLDVGVNESLCRVTHAVKGQAIQPGDLIANPVYHQDKNRKFHFTVVGDFDLDGDGVATAAEHDRLVRMVQTWGGIIDDTVSTQTDFVVAGARPSSPLAKFGSTEAGGVTEARTKRQTSYDATLDEAKKSSVPILNENRFLSMIGYYNTTVVRY